MNARSLPGLVAVALAVSGCVTGAHRVSPFGRAITVVPKPAAGFAKMDGELMAVGADSLWIRADTTLVPLPLAAIDHVAVRRHDLNGRTGLLWAVAGGLATGSALSAACSSVEDADCGGVFLGVMGVWLVLGGTSAASVETSAKVVIAAPDWEGLRPYARFPQGLPPPPPPR